MADSALINLSDANAGWGTIVYNGVTFPGLRDFTLVGTPIMDEAERAVVKTRYLLHLHFFVVDVTGSAHSATMLQMRKLLEEAGQQLVMTGIGLGDMTINGNGATFNDVEWGPKPAQLQIVSIGAIASECVWECGFTIKECGLGAFGSIIAYNYSLDLDYGDGGVVTRTVAGYLEIAQTRTPGNKTVAASADSYWQQIQTAISVPGGMERKGRKSTLSKNRNRLDFNFVDRQLDAEAPPAGALRADLDYEIESNPPGFAQFTATLAGSIEVPVGTPNIAAAQVFMSVMVDKTKKLKDATGTKGVVIPIRIRFGHGITTRRSSFGFSWLVTGCLDDLLKNGGIWEPVPGDYASWAKSMNDSWTKSVLLYSPAYDAIVDLCSGGTSVPPLGASAIPSAGYPSASSVFQIAKPADNVSWLQYEHTLKPQRTQAAVSHNLAQPYIPPGNSNRDIATLTGLSMAQDAQSKPNTTPPTTQYQGGPRDLVLSQGKAIRIGSLPAVPRLVSIGPNAVEEVTARLDGPKPIACFFGLTVYTVRWAITYRPTNGYWTTIPDQPNPMLCCDTKGNSK